ncbi:LOW QUALITY PROTEIN: hypothetical protein V2J09_016212 [Rumex salicifolius]
MEVEMGHSEQNSTINANNKILSYFVLNVVHSSRSNNNLEVISKCKLLEHSLKPDAQIELDHNNYWILWYVGYNNNKKKNKSVRIRNGGTKI